MYSIELPALCLVFLAADQLLQDWRHLIIRPEMLVYLGEQLIRVIFRPSGMCITSVVGSRLSIWVLRSSVSAYVAGIEEFGATVPLMDS